MKKILINLSNHPSTSWAEDQKRGWDEIVDVPFPNIPADADEEQVWKISREVFDRIDKIREEKEEEEVFLMMQGEFSLCYTLFIRLLMSWEKITVVVPTTERIVKEEITPSGEVKKTSTFKFVRWRNIKLPVL